MSASRKVHATFPASDANTKSPRSIAPYPSSCDWLRAPRRSTGASAFASAFTSWGEATARLGSAILLASRSGRGCAGANLASTAGLTWLFLRAAARFHAVVYRWSDESTYRMPPASEIALTENRPSLGRPGCDPTLARRK